MEGGVRGVLKGGFETVLQKRGSLITRANLLFPKRLCRKKIPSSQFASP